MTVDLDKIWGYVRDHIGVLIFLWIFLLGIGVFFIYSYGNNKRVFKIILDVLKSLFSIIMDLISTALGLLSSIFTIIVNFFSLLKRLFVGDISRSLITRGMSIAIMLFSAVSFVTISGGLTEFLGGWVAIIAAAATELTIIGISMHLFVFSKHKRLKWHRTYTEKKIEYNKISANLTINIRELGRTEDRLTRAVSLKDKISDKNSNEFKIKEALSEQYTYKKSEIYATKEFILRIKEEIFNKNNSLNDAKIERSKLSDLWTIMSYNIEDLGKLKIQYEKERDDKIEKLNDELTRLNKLSLRKKGKRQEQIEKLRLEQKDNTRSFKNEYDGKIKDIDNKIELISVFKSNNGATPNNETVTDIEAKIKISNGISDFDKKIDTLELEIKNLESQLIEQLESLEKLSEELLVVEDKFARYENVEQDIFSHEERKNQLKTQIMLLEKAKEVAKEEFDNAKKNFHIAIIKGKSPCVGIVGDNIEDKLTEEQKKNYKKNKKKYYSIQSLTAVGLAIAIVFSGSFTFVFSYEKFYMNSDSKSSESSNTAFQNDVLLESRLVDAEIREDSLSKIEKLNTDYKLILSPLNSDWNGFISLWNDGYNSFSKSAMDKQGQIDALNREIEGYTNLLNNANNATSDDVKTRWETAIDAAMIKLQEIEAQEQDNSYDGINGADGDPKLQLTREQNDEMNDAYSTFSSIVAGATAISLRNGKIKVDAEHLTEIKQQIETFLSYTERVYRSNVIPGQFSAYQPHLEAIKNNLTNLLSISIWLGDFDSIEKPPSLGETDEWSVQVRKTIDSTKNYIEKLPRLTMPAAVTDAALDKKVYGKFLLPDHAQYLKQVLKIDRLAFSNLKNLELAFWTLFRGHDLTQIIFLFVVSFLLDSMAMITCARRGHKLEVSVSVKRKQELCKTAFNPYNTISSGSFLTMLRLLRWLLWAYAIISIILILSFLCTVFYHENNIKLVDLFDFNKWLDSSVILLFGLVATSIISFFAIRRIRIYNKQNTTEKFYEHAKQKKIEKNINKQEEEIQKLEIKMLGKAYDKSDYSADLKLAGKKLEQLNKKRDEDVEKFEKWKRENGEYEPKILELSELKSIVGDKNAYQNMIKLNGSKYNILGKKYFKFATSKKLISFNEMLMEALHPCIAAILILSKSIERETLSILDETVNYVSSINLNNIGNSYATPFGDFLQSIGYARYSVLWNENERVYEENLLLTHEFFIDIFELISEHAISNGIDSGEIIDDSGKNLIN